MSIGKVINRLRTEKGLTQSELADIVGIHRQHLHRLEKDHFRPRQHTLSKLAEALGTTANNLTAIATSGIPLTLTQEEPELSDLLAKVHLLRPDEKHALVTFLKALLTCQQMEQLIQGAALGKAS